LFSDTIESNIRYGRLEASADEIRRAAAQANADEFIRGFPEGYSTMVGSRGTRLSGGERQRIAIARAILRDPRILILDEATSSLDAQSEALINEALGHLLVGRTTFIIAHRFSTIRRATTILVIEDGRVVERGHHADLIGRGGLYAKLYETQIAQPTET
jgi:subfamily B ATP-binding cassette protein MsbA